MRHLLLSLLCIVLLYSHAQAGGDPWQDLGIQRLDGPQAPDFTLVDISGRTLSLADFRGNVVFLNFWATWCPPCKEEMPAIEQLYRRFRERGLVVIAVNHYEDRETVTQFINKKGYTFPVPLDIDGTVSSTYRVNYLPVTFLIDRAGRLVGQVRGMRPWNGAGAFQLIEELLEG